MTGWEVSAGVIGLLKTIIESSTRVPETSSRQAMLNLIQHPRQNMLRSFGCRGF